MTIQLHDNDKHLVFAPLSLTRPIGNLRSGLLTNDERWKLLCPGIEVYFQTEDYLSRKFLAKRGAILVNAAVIPNMDLIRQLEALKEGEELIHNGIWIAKSGSGGEKVPYVGRDLVILENRWDLFKKNDTVLRSDFELLTAGKTSVQLSSSNTIIGDPTHIFLESGAKVEASILNTSTGPIYIGKDAEIMEGSLIRGPFGLGQGAVLKMGSKIYGATSIGPYCKIAGEVNNCLFQAYSNKAHDGFLGNSVIGEWCNLGAGTNTSNLKNNYGTVKTYSYPDRSLEQTDEQFMGLFMGDHSKCGINTMFNTASVVGVSSNVFGAEFPAKFIPSFTWGQGETIYNFEKAMKSANRMMERRNLTLSDAEIEILKHLSATK